MLNETQALGLREAYRAFETGKCVEAVRKLHDLAEGAVDPWAKAVLLYCQVVFLAQMGDAAQARSHFNELERAVDFLLPQVVPDTSDDTPPANLAVGIRYAELKTLLAERNQAQALQVLEDLISRYPKQLSGPASGVFHDIDLQHAFLLADAGRWEEAKPFLERACPPEEWKSVLCYYRGHCYCQFREYERAKQQLMEALHLGLNGHWEGRAHYILGIVEYYLAEMNAAKEQFELCVKTADPRYLGASRIWEWLEATSRALGQHEDAERYRKTGFDSPPSSRPN